MNKPEHISSLIESYIGEAATPRKSKSTYRASSDMDIQALAEDTVATAVVNGWSFDKAFEFYVPFIKGRTNDLAKAKSDVIRFLVKDGGFVEYVLNEFLVPTPDETDFELDPKHIKSIRRLARELGVKSPG